MKNTQSTILSIDNHEGDEPLSNHSDNASFQSIIEKRMSRRTMMKGSLGTALMGFFATTAYSPLAAAGSNKHSPLIGFEAIDVSAADTVTLPKGYKHQVMLPWGQPISGHQPAFDPLTNSGEDQAHQVGSHHDGMHFFPIEGKDPYQGSSEDGLLVMNHEYVEPRFMHASAQGKELSRNAVPLKADGQRDADEVLKEIHGHGVSVVRVKKQANGDWAVEADPRNRRIHGLTEMEISGPVRGTDFVKTKFSPDGTKTRGTLNNCAHGVTPWNTYLAAEENWAGYFINHGEQPREQTRYGVTKEGSGRYAWELADTGADEFVRYDVTPKGASATEDYRNEANAFGWMVEIDPFNPDVAPVKRTQLGRFAHEALCSSLPLKVSQLFATPETMRVLSTYTNTSVLSLTKRRQQAVICWTTVPCTLRVSMKTALAIGCL
ncbi:putative phosphatase [Nitrincola nitratireducens]|uniref:Putative phosphatase n=1 Tax=Nitrincola nitratireducens TaxID=1229521 RepID=W9URQ1_9GAMM|nr:putative phosphatase [Nitrincola nitratireducens]